MSRQDTVELDRKILDMISEIRAEHHACTGGEVARRLNMDRDLVKYRIQQLRKRGIVDYNEVPGSVRLVPLEDQAERRSPAED